MKKIITTLGIALFLSPQISVYAEHIKMIVKEEKTNCYKEDEQQSCLWVKLKDYKDWSSLAAPIENFDYEEGYRYELIVDRTKPANGSKNIDDFTYKLVKIVNQEQVASAPGENYQHLLNNKLYISYFLDQDIAEAELYLTLNNNKISIKGPCNILTGTYTANGNYLNFGPISATRRACIDADAANLEQNILKAFDNKHLKYTISDNYILVFHKDKHIMSLTKDYQNKAYQNLSAHQWKLYKYDTTLMMDRFIKSTIQFDPNDNKVSGNDGCNTFSGHVEISKNSISFNNMTSTMKGCIDMVQNEIAMHYARLFNAQNVTFAIIDNRLYFYIGDKPIMIFDKIKQ